ncbi:hypothetical protein [Aquamicrobium defluvii]|uniref:hypothetical protein n=1 Tax=Aquamicrobium defluvii TaxID=69279 RepID=UPI0012EC25F9|nr:hypothetical protein [Aquamicrobium defluvii]
MKATITIDSAAGTITHAKGAWISTKKQLRYPQIFSLHLSDVIVSDRRQFQSGRSRVRVAYMPSPLKEGGLNVFRLACKADVLGCAGRTCGVRHMKFLSRLNAEPTGWLLLLLVAGVLGTLIFLVLSSITI